VSALRELEKDGAERDAPKETDSANVQEGVRTDLDRSAKGASVVRHATP
jgi:hypothetical protein